MVKPGAVLVADSSWLSSLTPLLGIEPEAEAVRLGVRGFGSAAPGSASTASPGSWLRRCLRGQNWVVVVGSSRQLVVTTGVLGSVTFDSGRVDSAAPASTFLTPRTSLDGSTTRALVVFPALQGSESAGVLFGRLFVCSTKL